MKCCCCGAGFRACPRRPRHRRGRGAARLRRRVARRSAACPPATPGYHTGAAAHAAGGYRRGALSRACATDSGRARDDRGIEEGAVLFGFGGALREEAPLVLRRHPGVCIVKNARYISPMRTIFENGVDVDGCTLSSEAAIHRDGSWADI